LNWNCPSEYCHKFKEQDHARATSNSTSSHKTLDIRNTQVTTTSQSINMPNGFPAALANQYPNEKPPSWFHPASPKIKPAKPAKDVDAASMASTSTFSSTVGLIKDSVKRKLPVSYKEHRARKDAEAASNVVKEKEVVKTRESKQLPEYNARKETGAAFFYLASVK